VNSRESNKGKTKESIPAFRSRSGTSAQVKSARLGQPGVYPDPGLASQTAIQKFVRDPRNPFLISFPRTGSHWVRIIAELYFERPLLVRTFFYPGREDYLFLHDHDVKLTTRRQNVIYLYRDPVDTVFSRLMYSNEDINDRSRIAYWADLYGRHLDKWLHSERFTTHKTVLSYENLQQAPFNELKKLLHHFNMPLNPSKLQSAIQRVSKETVREYTKHDPQVMSPLADYEQLKEDFRERYKDFVWNCILARAKGQHHPVLKHGRVSQCGYDESGLSNKDHSGIPSPHSTERGLDFIDVGFHGDQYLLRLVDLIIDECDYFIETGTNVGSTLAYVARSFPNIRCLSCEPDARAFQEAVKNTAEFSNVSIYNETSQAFITHLKQHERTLFEANVLFWLDAHGYGFDWPLKEEVFFVTRAFKRAYVLIDDCKVPGLDCFGYDKYKEQICSFDYVKDAINPHIEYQLYYPCYKDRTSRYHPLRGWGLIVFGLIRELELPGFLQDKVKRVL
jgi:hypothetical protein